MLLDHSQSNRVDILILYANLKFEISDYSLAEMIGMAVNIYISDYV